MKNTIVKFINYPKAYESIKSEIDSAIQRCLSTGDLIFRQDLIDFEQKFAKLHGCKYGIGTGSCTGAMFITLKALGIGPGDEVITVAHTYVATVDVIKACGATPVLVDVNESDMLMDVELVEQAITRKTKAVIPVHLNGAMCDMKALRALCDHRFFLIEDAAQSPLAQRDGIMPGQLSDAACFSFYPAKVLGGYGEGGMVITNNDKLQQKLYLLRDHGESPGYFHTPKLDCQFSKRSHKTIECWGYNTILDNIDAAVLNVKLKYLEGWIKRRRKLAHRYDGTLCDLPINLQQPPEVVDRFDVFQNYVIRCENRNVLQAYLESKGIETMVSWPIPLHKQPALTELHQFNLPVTEEISRTCLSLPMYPELMDEEVEYVIENTRLFFE